MAVVFFLTFYILRKPKPQATDALVPLLEKTVQELGMKYCKAKLDEDHAVEIKRVDAHSDEIKTLREESKECVEKIEKRVRKAEGKILTIENDVEHIKGSITDIKEAIKNGNDSLRDFISQLFGSKK